MNELTVQQNIEHKIFTIRGVQVMIDRDLAELYGVEPKRLGEQVKRNIERFPDEFRFQLTEDEKNELVANCDRLQPLKHSSSLPYVFTEQGVSMLSAVLRSDTAIQTSINIINSFVTMRKYLLQNASLFQRVEKLELDQKQTNQKLESVLSALESKSITPKQGVFFDGQIFDAYALMSEIVKKATQSLILIDNYIDESTLTHLSKADVKVKITILTKTITKQLELDIKKYNAQYGNLRAVEFASSHDRFLIIDAREIYHIGASLKDLGKKWFAFSLLEVESFGLMERVKKVVGDE
ncbi:MAG: ORF6N domain-containing protein [Arcobacteraceae bacterium]|nr:ORF6N domain-containing protein [Arcobacteraceae bacterium]